MTFWKEHQKKAPVETGLFVKICSRGWWSWYPAPHPHSTCEM